MIFGEGSAEEAFMWTIMDIRDEEKLETYIDSEIIKVAWESIIPKMEQAIMKYIVPEKKSA